MRYGDYVGGGNGGGKGMVGEGGWRVCVVGFGWDGGYVRGVGLSGLAVVGLWSLE